MKQAENMLILSLQCFAEGGGGEGAASGNVANSDSGENAASTGQEIVAEEGGNEVHVAGGQNSAEQVETEDRQAQFNKMIKGEYKDLYDAQVKEIIQKRLKNSKEYEEKYNALQPVIELLSGKYGVDASDSDALRNAIEDDDTFFEEAALEMGVTVQQYKEIKKIERENAELKKQMQEQSMRDEFNRMYSSWFNQAEEVKKTYPNFDLEAELNNETFLRLIQNNVDVKSAYEVVHKDEIIPAAMQFAVNQTEQKIANKIRSGGNRPLENGMNAQSPVSVKKDIEHMSKAELNEIIARVRGGEKIKL